MMILDNNKLTGGAAHVCDANVPSLFSTDCCKGDGCTTGELECECCTFCCADKETGCYDHGDLLANHDMDWFATGTDYNRGAYIFSEDIVFDTV